MAALEELLQNLRVPFVTEGHHHCRPGWLQIDCPFCGADSQRFHLGYNLEHGYFSCWKCRGHSVKQVLTALNASPSDIAAVLGDARERYEPAKAKPRTGLRIPACVGPLLNIHKRYLRGRGFDPDHLVDVWKLGGLGLAPRLGWRIYIPIFLGRQQVSWTTRAIGDKVTQRYLSASPQEEAVNHKHVVYGLEHCVHSVVVVEGPADAWAVGPGAGALFGTAFSTAQVRLLSKIPRRVICFDRTAQEDAEELARQLSCFPGTTINVQIEAKDPGEASERELSALRRLARL